MGIKAQAFKFLSTEEGTIALEAVMREAKRDAHLRDSGMEIAVVWERGELSTRMMSQGERFIHPDRALILERFRGWDIIDESQGVRNVFADACDETRLAVRQLAVSTAVADEDVSCTEFDRLRYSVPEAVHYLLDADPVALKDLVRETLLAWAEAEMGEESPFYMVRAAQDVLAELEREMDAEDECD